MKKTDVLLALERLEQAVARLEDTLGRVRDDLDRDGAIQRFEFTVELLWKTLSIYLAYQGISCQTPRNCIKLAFRHGLIDDDEILLDMIEDRNRSSHVYNEKIADDIFTRISKMYMTSIRQVLNRLENAL